MPKTLSPCWGNGRRTYRRKLEIRNTTCERRSTQSPAIESPEGAGLHVADPIEVHEDASSVWSPVLADGGPTGVRIAIDAVDEAGPLEADDAIMSLLSQTCAGARGGVA